MWLRNNPVFPGTQGNLSHQTKRRFVFAVPKLFPADTQLVNPPEAVCGTFGMRRGADSYIKANDCLALD